MGTSLVEEGRSGDSLAEGVESPAGCSSSSCDIDTARKWSTVKFLSRSPGSRVFPSALTHNGNLYVLGGHDGTLYRNELLVFNLETRSWAHDLKIHGVGPTPRDAHIAVAYGDSMYVFGGYDSKRYLNDFHRYHFESSTWSPVSFTGSAPSPRGGHSAVVFENRAVLFGGCNGWNYFNDCFVFDFGTEEWSPMRVSGAPPSARSAPARIIHEKEGAMYVFGGYDGTRSLNDLHRLDLRTSEWSLVRTSGKPPCPRGGHTAVKFGNGMYIFGGKSGRSPFNDLCKFDFETGEWERIETGSSGPSPRCAHVSFVDGGSMFIFGGYDGRQYFDDCYEFSIQSLTSSSVFSLAGDLGSMVNNENFSDISFMVEGHVVYAHKFILFARCEYFRRMFTSGYKESTSPCVTIGDVPHKVFLCVLTYLYTGRLPKLQMPEFPASMAIELMSVANLYDIDPLKRMCADLVCNSLTVENCAAILQAADSYQALQLRSACINFITINFARVVRSDGFKELINADSSNLLLSVLQEASSRLVLADDADGLAPSVNHMTL